MSPIQIRPERAAEEILEFNRKLGAGLRNLADIGPIEAGVTPKEVVYREDKLVLYRFQALDSVLEGPSRGPGARSTSR